MSPRFDAYVFDLDGTLLDTMDDFVAVTNTTLAQMGSKRTYTRPEILDCFQRGGIVVLLQEELGQELPEEKGKEVYRTWYGTFAEHGLEHTKLYPHVKETLATLKAQGAKLAVLSNKPDADTKNVISHFFPDVPFSVVRGQVEGVPVKPDKAGALLVAEQLGIAPADFLYLGDTKVDMTCACSAGMNPVGVLWGFRTAQELLDNGAKVLIAHPMELLNTISEFN